VVLVSLTFWRSASVLDDDVNIAIAWRLRKYSREAIRRHQELLFHATDIGKQDHFVAMGRFINEDPPKPEVDCLDALEEGKLRLFSLDAGLEVINGEPIGDLDTKGA